MQQRTLLAFARYVVVFATVLLGVLAQPWTLPWGLLADPLPLGGFALPGWTIALWLGLVCTAVAYFTGVSAIKRLSPQVAGGVAYLEVVTAIVLAWALLGEALTPVQILGAVVIVTGAFIAQTAVPAAPVTTSSTEAASEEARPVPDRC